MRVIAGSAGRIPLRVPHNQLRPTMDMVKGAVFSILAEAVAGARVLDLFAGSGGLGIEALSRGALEATFVEADRRACECIHENLRKTRLSGDVHRGDVFDFLKHPRPNGGMHLVFADPPYAKNPDSPDLAARLLLSEKLPLHLAPDALLVLEVREGWRLPPTSFWQLRERRKYGSTEILLLNPSSP